MKNPYIQRHEVNSNKELAKIAATWFLIGLATGGAFLLVCLSAAFVMGV